MIAAVDVLRPRHFLSLERGIERCGDETKLFIESHAYERRIEPGRRDAGDLYIKRNFFPGKDLAVFGHKSEDVLRRGRENAERQHRKNTQNANKTYPLIQTHRVCPPL